MSASLFRPRLGSFTRLVRTEAFRPWHTTTTNNNSKYQSSPPLFVLLL